MIRGHLLNVDSGQANHKMFHLLPGVRGQFVSCQYPFNVYFYLPIADFIDPAWNSPCGSAQMVEVGPEEMHEHLSVTTRECSWINNVD